MNRFVIAIASVAACAALSCSSDEPSGSALDPADEKLLDSVPTEEEAAAAAEAEINAETADEVLSEIEKELDGN